MANPKHVALVRKGAKAVAEWRDHHPNTVLDLAGATLSNADLSWMNLSGASLAGTDLSDANLTQANLSDANLSDADLSNTDLNGADLGGANLRGANLFEANLSRANLHLADLTGATAILANFFAAYLGEAKLRQADLFCANLSAGLIGADVPEAQFGQTSLNDVDLSGVKGLDDVFHEFPSSVGTDSLIASFRGAGNRLTPELTTFFRGAGVPEELLRELPRIVAEVKYYSCFTSYGQPDVEFAKKLCQDLEAAGVPCWLYDMDKTVGKRTWGEIGEARRSAGKFVVLCSSAALVRDGVLQEIEDQINEDPDRVVPISLDGLWREPGFRIVRGNHNLKPQLENRNCADFANKSYGEALEELLKGLRRPQVKKPRRSRKSS